MSLQISKTFLVAKEKKNDRSAVNDVTGTVNNMITNFTASDTKSFKYIFFLINFTIPEIDDLLIFYKSKIV